MRFDYSEGATPIQDCSDLLLPWVQTKRDLNRVEAENISYAQKKYLRRSSQEISSWFHYKELQSIHHAMFWKVWAWAGKTRKSVTSIGVAPGLISMKIAELCKEVSSWSTTPIELTFLEKSARIHHQLVYIHPFENGNGRFSRLVADRCLLFWKCPHPIWPDDLYYEGAVRKRYIQALKAADRGNYVPLVCLMKDHGAADPNLSLLLQKKIYRPYLNLAKVRALLRNGEDPNCISEKGQGSLQLIIKSKIEHHRKAELIKLLVEQGAEINRIDASGLTPLQTAVAIGDKKIAFFLRSKKNNQVL